MDAKRLKEWIGRMDAEKFVEDVDWGVVMGCVAVGFLSGILANWWWNRRQAERRKDGDQKEQRIALTYPL